MRGWNGAGDEEDGAGCRVAPERDLVAAAFPPRALTMEDATEDDERAGGGKERWSTPAALT